MKQHSISAVLAAAILLLGTGLSSAVENNTGTPQQAITKAEASPKNANSEIVAGYTHHARTKLVDINTATKRELKKLHGIGDAEADKIIAARPFGSKAWLVTKKIIPIETYQAISGKIICKLTKEDIDKIEAQAAHDKK
ncbi:MAG: helix-hairpin-helix domain-containing protein [Gallionella sp.]